MDVFVEEEVINYDYSKYLGKDYKKDDKPAAYICNHTSWFDIILLIDRISSGFITGAHVKDFFMIGYIATTLGCIFVDRDDKNNRGKSLSNILTNKLTNIYESKDVSRIAIFPEGTTSNTTSILPFKKGAFIAKLPLQPYVITFEVRDKISLAWEVLELLVHVFALISVPTHKVKLYTFRYSVLTNFSSNRIKQVKRIGSTMPRR
jgi:lysophosphatidylcholine acyltransferase/lyso-PAF acetyltransferase